MACSCYLSLEQLQICNQTAAKESSTRHKEILAHSGCQPSDFSSYAGSQPVYPVTLRPDGRFPTCYLSYYNELGVPPQRGQILSCPGINLVQMH